MQAVLVLFDLPDFMIISAYVLLALVWAEAFIQSRSHWLSVKHFRRCVKMATRGACQGVGVVGGVRRTKWSPEHIDFCEIWASR